MLVLWEPYEPDAEEWDELLAWVRDGGRLIYSGRTDRFGGRVAEIGSGPARHAAITPETIRIREIDSGPGSFTALPEGALVHLTRDSGDPALISWPEGEGRIHWSADPEWLANGRIAKADNLDLALRLLTPPPGTKTAFDEYHHGYQVAERWWQILRGPLQVFLVQLGIALALLYWAYWVRFGSPRPTPASPPRAAVEYVYSMGQLYRRARARAMVLQSLRRSLMRTLGRLVGGATGLSHGEIARLTADQAGIPAEEIRALLDRLDPDQGPEPNEAELLLLTREAEELQRRVRSAGYRDQRDAGKGAGGAS